MKTTLLTVIAMTALALGLHAQEKKPEWKDRAEFDLYDSIVKDQNAQTRLQSLDKWKTGYAGSEYADVRLKAYLYTYKQLMRHRDAINTAVEILKTDPNDIDSLTEIVGFVLTLLPQGNAALTAQNRADIDLGEKTARYIVANVDTIYAPTKKPQGTTDEQWAAAKPTVRNFSQFTIARLALAAKDNAKAETELKKTVEMDPTNAQASYMLATILLGQQKTNPEKMPAALYQYARSATYDGQGALDAATRKTVDTFLTKAYNAYHGSADGLTELKAAAKASATGTFAIMSTVEIAKKKQEEREAYARANPMLAFWTNSIKENLVGDNSESYWGFMNGALLPGDSIPGVAKFKGKIISLMPETNPKEIMLSIAGGEMADAKLILDDPLRGTMDVGMEIGFAGAAKEFTKDPFMVTFEVDPDDVEGWTGKGPAAPPRTRVKRVPKKKQ